MEGLYLYCIRQRTDARLSCSVSGIDGRHEVTTIPYRDLEAVVSEVSLEEFGSEAIQTKAREDLNWIKEKAIAHQSVIEEAMRADKEIISLIPMRFGTIFKGEDSLKESLDEHYAQFKATLEKVKGKQEWSLKLYLADRKKLEQAIKEASDSIREKENQIASLTEGMSYFVEKELEELVRKETDRAMGNIQKDVMERLAVFGAEVKEGKILGKELTGRPEPMVLNVSHLIEKEKLPYWKVEAEKIREEIKTKGLSLEYSGPWPAYNFVS